MKEVLNKPFDFEPVTLACSMLVDKQKYFENYHHQKNV